ncbi:MAG: GMC family oxidoreductase N-terminal domain-containing protein [Gammaproteobacteria bacterium]
MILSDPPQQLRTEVAVIGSGPGGAVIASNLAQAGKSALLIEEGENLPQESSEAFSFAEMKQKYRSGGVTVAFGKPNIAYAEGACVGGGSEVNSGLYHSLPDEVINRWSQEFGVDDFSAASLQPHFAETQKLMEPSRYPGTVPESSRILADGAASLGWSSGDIPRLVEFTGETDQQGVEKSRRRSMTKTYIPKFLENGGQLLPQTRVIRLRKNSAGQWQLSALVGGKNPVEITADSVFVCCGAINTPALLLRSGLRHNVGRSLALQPMAKVTARFERPVNFHGLGIAAEQVKEFSPDYSFGCSISSKAHLAINLLPYADGTSHAMEDFSHLVSYYVMSRGNSTGRVSNIPGFRDPVVRYQISQLELENLGRGIKNLSRLLLAAGAEMVYTGVREQAIVHNEGDAAQLPDRLAFDSANIMTVHLMGSCPMGENKERTATNSYGRVHDVNGLYVADASTLCDSPAVNPQGTIMALANRSSYHFLNEG